MSFITRRKPIDTITQQDEHHRLKPTLRWPHLVAMGVGAIVGTGIYTLTGIGAGLAGPGVILSFLLCGVLCACAALCYAELSTLIPVAVGWSAHVAEFVQAAGWPIPLNLLSGIESGGLINVPAVVISLVVTSLLI